MAQQPNGVNAIQRAPKTHKRAAGGAQHLTPRVARDARLGCQASDSSSQATSTPDAALGRAWRASKANVADGRAASVRSPSSPMTPEAACNARLTWGEVGQQEERHP